LKLGKVGQRIAERGVAPHAGAWIETNGCSANSKNEWTSRLTRARGLKHLPQQKKAIERAVAPHAGAWIETSNTSCALALMPSRLTRARGLKHNGRGNNNNQGGSRLTRARGLKLTYRFAASANIAVAPHAGAWIETMRRLIEKAKCRSRASRGRVD